MFEKRPHSPVIKWLALLLPLATLLPQPFSAHANPLVLALSVEQQLTPDQINDVMTIIYDQEPGHLTAETSFTVGDVIPETLPVRPVSSDVVRVVPSFENHAYIVLADGRIVIIEPVKLEVVAILG